MKLTHEQILEWYSGVKSGQWTDNEVREDLIKKFESYKIQQMGFNCETWFKDLADELQIQVGVASA